MHVFDISRFSAAKGERPATLCPSAIFEKSRGNTSNHVQSLHTGKGSVKVRFQGCVNSPPRPEAGSRNLGIELLLKPV